ncbi:MAG: hypothetical protein NC452_17505 [Eubacterium sp.]|nr:hypothetical protein [Eubacterium sp.]
MNEMRRFTNSDEKGKYVTYLFSENVLEIEDMWRRGDVSEVGFKARGEIIDRLAEYENTGLFPEEIKALQADNEKLHRLIDDLERCVSKQ